MKVLVANSTVPFVRGGAELLQDNLIKNLRARGYEADSLCVPFRYHPFNALSDSMMIWRRLEGFNADQIIALKFPAYLVRHPQKVLWVLHQYRQAYDLWDTPWTNIPASEEGKAVRQAIRNADGTAFSEAKRVFVNSPVTGQRMWHFNQQYAEVLRPPVNDPELFTPQSYEPYIFCGGRINGGKRQALLAEAMHYVKSDVRMVIAGPPDTPEDEQRLRAIVEASPRANVELKCSYLSRRELGNLVSRALACAYIPYDEDSYGYVAMEAVHAGKAVITTTDSGGILGLVKPGETGLVAEPDPYALAEVIDKLASDERLAQKMGGSARQFWQSLDITWDRTIELLMR